MHSYTLSYSRLKVELGKVTLTNEGLRKLMEESSNESQKSLISKTLTKQSSQF